MGFDLRFSHFGIFVHDLEAMARFYSQTLGFFVTDRGKLPHVDLVFLSRDPEEHHQMVLASGRPQDVPFNTVNQISFRCPALADLRAFQRAVAGMAFAKPVAVTHGNAWSVYCLDPEGNRLEIFVDSPWHVEQPIRETLDLAKSDAQILAETEQFCRGRPGFMPRAERTAQMRKLMGL